MDPTLIEWQWSQISFFYTSLLFLFRLDFTCFGLLIANETEWLEKNYSLLGVTQRRILQVLNNFFTSPCW
jgi:hypothetical protein